VSSEQFAVGTRISRVFFDVLSPCEIRVFLFSRELALIRGFEIEANGASLEDIVRVRGILGCLALFRSARFGQAGFQVDPLVL